MYQTVKTSTSFDASLAIVDGRGIAVNGYIQPVLCSTNYAQLDHVAANLSEVVGGFAESSLADLGSGRSKRVAGHASVEQLIAAR